MDVNSDLLPKTNQQFKLYRKRWFILFLYILYAGINAFQWFEYSIIANIIMKFYNIDAVSVDWTAIIYVILYMPMVIPASYLINKTNLRTIAIIGVSGTAIGTTIKIFSLDPEQLWLVYLGQTILSSMQVFILALPPRIAAIWFGPKEVSLACSLGVFGTQLGQALGFAIPPILVKNHEQIDKIAKDLGVLTQILAVCSLAVAVAVLFWFSPRPPTAPNQNQIEEDEDFLKCLKNLLTDSNFNLLTISYGINIAVFVAISTLLNQFVLFYFPGSEEDAGRIGLLMVTLGMIGSIIFGYILDKTHRYKETTLTIYILATVAVLAFMFALESGSIIPVYFAGATLGLFTNAYMPVGLELAIELTYPEPESTSSGILISMTQTLGAIFTLLLGWLYARIGSFWSLSVMVLFLLIGVLLTVKIANIKKRQEAFKQSVEKVVVQEF